MGRLVLPINNGSEYYEGSDKDYGRFFLRNYKNENAVENVIRDITRTRINEPPEELYKLRSYGAVGINYQMPVELMIDAFKYVQIVYKKDSGKYRKVYHEVFWFDKAELDQLCYSQERIWQFAYECACTFYRAGHQVIFAVHSNEGKYHIHFAVNTVSFLDGHLLRTYKYDQKDREKLFMNILYKYMMLPKIPRSAFYQQGVVYLR